MDVRHQLFPALVVKPRVLQLYISVLQLYILVFTEGLLYLWSPFSTYFQSTANVREIQCPFKIAAFGHCPESLLLWQAQL